MGVPGLALAYLAVRGIRNETASREQRWLGEQRAVSRQVSDTFARVIADAERDLARAAAGTDSATGRSSSLRSLKRQHPVIEEVFYVADGRTIHLPSAELLYQPDDSLGSVPPRLWPAAAAAHLRAARRREYQQRDYAAALGEYRQALATVRDSALRGEVLVAITRTQRKAGQLDAALASCAVMAERYGRVRSEDGLPLGPAARLEQGSLLLAKGDSLAAIRTQLGLYQALVRGEWEVERAQYVFFAGRAAEAIAQGVARLSARDSADAYRRTLADLKTREAARRRSTERRLRFQDAAAEEVRARLSSGGTRNTLRFAFESGGETYLVSVLPESSAGERMWGVLWDADALARLAGGTLADRTDPAAVDWVVKTQDGRTLASRGAASGAATTLDASFAGGFPPWLLELSPRPVSGYRRLFASSVYVYMFVLIAGILVFGLTLTVRAVSHELELARLKSDFVSTVSHEFKSPITSIRHLAEMLQAGSVPSEERRRRYYDVLVEQSARLSSLVTDILDLTRLEEGKKDLALEAVDVGALVRGLVTATQRRVGDDGYVVEARIDEGLPAARADREALARAITNLLDNAIKYSPKAKAISVHAFRADGQVAVTVEDRGVGIPAGEIDRVFERFYRGGYALTRAVKGTGLGLALVREIVEAHGGTVDVKSELGWGSTFTIWLPAMTEGEDVENLDHRG